MAGKASKSTKWWNTDITDFPADELLYTDYAEVAKTNVCNYKFKTNTQKIDQWIEIFRDEYKGAKWEQEGCSTTLMSVKIGVRKLVIRLCKETGIVVVQGAHMHQWKERFNEWKALLNVACSDSSISITPDTTVTTPDPSAPSDSESKLQALNASIALLEEPLPPELMDPIKEGNARMDAIESELNKTILDLGSPLQESTPFRPPPTQGSNTNPPSTQSATQSALAEASPDPDSRLIELERVASNWNGENTQLAENERVLREYAAYTSDTPHPSEDSPSPSPVLTSTAGIACDTEKQPRNATPRPTAPSPDSPVFTSTAGDSESPPVPTTPPSEADVVLVRALTEMLQAANNQNAGLRAELNELKGAANNAPNPVAEATMPRLILSSSICRDFDSAKLVNTVVIARSGAKPKQLQRILEAKHRDGEKFSGIDILAGGNSITKNCLPQDIPAIVEEVQLAVLAAQQLTSHVRVAEVPPRKSGPCYTNGITELNTQLKSMANSTGAAFIETGGYLYTRNGQRNAALYEEDEVHLTLAGSKLLLQCFGVPVKSGETGVSPRAAYNKPSPPSPKKTPPQTPPAAKRKNAKTKGAQNIKKGRDAKTPRPNQQHHYQKEPQTPAWSPSHTPTGHITHIPQLLSMYVQPPQYKDLQQAYPQRGSKTQVQGYAPGPKPTPQYGSPKPSHQYRGPKPPQQYSGPRSQGHQNTNKCQLCNGQGHSAVTCNSKKSHCYKCQRIGHLHFVCPF